MLIFLLKGVDRLTFDIFADLHTHSVYSDGTDSPRELVQRAKMLNLKALALTDHDTVAGLAEFVQETRRNGIQTIPGVEISTSIDGLRIHILGYYVDYENYSLLEFLKFISAARTQNTESILNRLCQLGLLEYAWEKVIHHCGEKAWICSSDVFIAMMKDGYYTKWEQWPDFYNRYFSKSSKAYIDIGIFTAIDAIKIILEAGGIPVLAHPKLVGDDSKIPLLVENGLLGIEAYYPAHSVLDTKRYLELAKKYGLVVTGGTDWHGKLTEWDTDLGKCGVGEKELLVLSKVRSRMRNT